MKGRLSAKYNTIVAWVLVITSLCMLKYNVILPPPRKPRGIVLASSAGGPGFNPQSRTASYYYIVLGKTNCNRNFSSIYIGR